MGEDATWRAIEDVAARLEGFAAPPLKVRAARRVSLGSMTEGIEVSDPWTDVWEPVRRRGRLGGAWAQITPIDEAEARVAGFLRDRSDLG